jgi:AcrR family transcriptional regulator
MSIVMDAKMWFAEAAMDTKKRSYEMRARRQTTDATRTAIVQAAIDSVVAARSLGITLGSVADRAGVTVKTVLRHFGSREELIEAAYLQVLQDVLAERTVTSSDPERALTVLIEHYERRGDMVLGLIAEEDDDPRARRMCDTGRTLHRNWVDEVFGAGLPDEPSERARIIDALVVVTDVYCWKLLRRDRGLTVEDVRDRMALLSEAVLSVSRDAVGRS